MKTYTNSLEDYIVEVLNKHGIYGSLCAEDRNDIYDLIVDMIQKNASKQLNKSGYVVVGVEKEELEKAIITAPVLLRK